MLSLRDLYSLFLSIPQENTAWMITIDALGHCFESADCAAMEIRLLRIEELLLYLFQSDPDRFHAIEILTRDKQQLQIKKVVESQIGQPTTVDDLAFLCHMSTSTFKRKFSEIYQTSPQKWLLARRLELAADLLKSFEGSPSGIYMKVGYQNHSSFSEAFRNHFGSTPSDFQQKHLNVTP